MSNKTHSSNHDEMMAEHHHNHEMMDMEHENHEMHNMDNMHDMDNMDMMNHGGHMMHMGDMSKKLKVAIILMIPLLLISLPGNLRIVKPAIGEMGSSGIIRMIATLSFLLISPICIMCPP